MKRLTIAISAFFSFAALASSHGAPSINLGCFQYGPNDCNLSSNPPSITGGFQFGPQSTTEDVTRNYRVTSLDNGFCIYHNLYSVALGNVGSVLQVSMNASGVTFTDPTAGYSNVDTYPVGTFSEPIMDDSGALILTGQYLADNIYEEKVKGEHGSDPGDVYFVRITRNGNELVYQSGNGAGVVDHTCNLRLVSP